MAKQQKIGLNEKQPFAIERIQKIAAYIKQRQRQLYILSIVTIIVTIGTFLFKNYQRKQDTIAQSELFQAVYYFEENQFEKALQGDGVHAGFLTIIKEYRFTNAANLAHFYASVSYLHQQNYEQALTHLKKFRATDFLIQARAWSLIGDIRTAQQAYEEAAKYYLKAADYKVNAVFTPYYLTKAALAYEAVQAYQLACDCYQRIMRDFPDTQHHGKARKHLSRLEGLL